MNNMRRGLPLARAHVEQIFPKLTPAQIRRIGARGHIRAMERGEVLYEQGDSAAPFFVVVSGELEVVDYLEFFRSFWTNLSATDNIRFVTSALGNVLPFGVVHIRQ
jgi:hypothetical protein